MNIQEAKQIKIADYLQSLGHRPVKQQGANLFTSHPLRNESEASFKGEHHDEQLVRFRNGQGRQHHHPCVIPLRIRQLAISLGQDGEASAPCTPDRLFFSLSKLPSRVLRDWRLGNSTILHSCAI